MGIKLKAFQNQTSVSVDGVEYSVVDGIVELPQCNPVSLKHLQETHGMALCEGPEPEAPEPAKPVKGRSKTTEAENPAPPTAEAAQG